MILEPTQTLGWKLRIGLGLETLPRTTHRNTTLLEVSVDGGVLETKVLCNLGERPTFVDVEAFSFGHLVGGRGVDPPGDAGFVEELQHTGLADGEVHR